jgi:acetyl-CoA synthetase
MNFIPSKFYQEQYQQSINNPDEFWAKQALQLSWFKKPLIAKNTSFDPQVKIKWFEDGELNACYNCVDRHVEAGRGQDIAIIWQGDDPTKSKKVSYLQLQEQVKIFANILQKNHVKKGDRVIIYLPMIVEACYAMLACARIGAVHCVVFAGFSSSALADRIKDCQPNLIITADQSIRGGKLFELKHNVDQAQEILKSKIATLVVKNTNNQINWHSDRDLWLSDQAQSLDITQDNLAKINAEEPFFILYTSGSTGKPKGILHTTAGYLLYCALTFKYAFDYQPCEVFWCSADIGWITGHSYTIYGALLNGATTLIYEGVPNYPTPSRFWQVIDQHKVNIFYTAPTAIRALMREGDDYVKAISRKTLRILGSVGEPINPEAWQWYYDIVGEKKCKIVDTWWQTETGGHMILPLPNHIKPKPSMATLPFFGIKPVLLNDDGKEIIGEGEGNLCIAEAWPGMARSIYQDHQRFEETYFKKFPGYYFSADTAKRDQDGYFRITSRADDVIKVSGHRLGSAEIEAVINEHSKVSESAVIGIPHAIKGEAIYIFVIVKQQFVTNDDHQNDILKAELKQLVRQKIGAIASPESIDFVDDLPKTRSGKIMRRIIRKIICKDYENLGDLSTLTNPQIVETLIKKYKEL